MDLPDFREICNDIEDFYHADLDRAYTAFVISNTYEVPKDVVEEVWIWYDVEDNPETEEIYEDVIESDSALTVTRNLEQAWGQLTNAFETVLDYEKA